MRVGWRRLPIVQNVTRNAPAGSGLFRGIMAAVAVLWTAGSVAPAAADTRTLDLYYVHTGERAQITYKKDGRYIPDALKKLNWMLRDWRLNQSTRMDPALFDLVWEVYRQSGSRKPITVTSPYRAPATNNMLRRRSRGVAKNSQHTHGKAMDWFVADVPTAKLRAIALRLQRGGVGYYPTSRTPFVHTDTGSVRHWPRMSRSQLLAVFPDGKTLHVPSDGKPLQGYKEALAGYLSYKRGSGRGDDAETRQLVQFSNSIGSDRDTRLRPAAGNSKNLFAMLFGGGADEEEDSAYASSDGGGDEEAAPAPAKPTAVASRSAPQTDEPAESLPGVAASAPSDGATRSVATTRTAPAVRAPAEPPAEAEPEAPVVATPAPPAAAPARPVAEPSAEALLASMSPPAAGPTSAAVIAAMSPPKKPEVEAPETVATTVVAAVRVPVPAPERVVLAAATPLSKPPELLARANVGSGIPPVLGYASDARLATEGGDVLAETARTVMRGSVGTPAARQRSGSNYAAANQGSDDTPLGASELGLEPPAVIVTGDPDPFAEELVAPDRAEPMLLAGTVTVRTMVFASFTAPNAKALPQLVAAVDLPGDNDLHAGVVPGPRTDRFEGSSIGAVQFAALP